MSKTKGCYKYQTWIFLALAIFTQIAKAADSACDPLLLTEDQMVLGQYLKQGLGDRTSSRQTAFYRGMNEKGQVVLVKNKRTPWRLWGPEYWESNATAKDGGNTRQGDPRWFAALAGPELASNFNFDIQETDSQHIILIPGATLFKKTIVPLNTILIEQGKEPIVYLPVKSGFLTDSEILELSLSAEEPFVTYAPYADDIPSLVAHEWNWHAGGIFLPPKFHRKSNQIDQEFARVIKKLERSGLANVQKVITLLKAERAYELDAGNANPVASLANIRLTNKMEPYSNCKNLSPKDVKFFKEFIEFLARPSLSAQEVVVKELVVLLNLNSLAGLAADVEFPVSPDIFAETKFIILTAEEKNAYTEWVKKLIADPFYVKNQPKTREKAEDWLFEMFDTMDERIKDMNNAFRILRQRQG